MSHVKKNSLLLILPVSLVVLSVLMLQYQGPYYLGNYFEDYPYLLNGLSILTFHAPGHTDHPGTTLQLLSAIVILGKWLAAVVFGSWAPISESVLGNSESYLKTLSFALNLLIASALHFAGRRVYQLTDSLTTALILQASPFLFSQILITQIRVQNEPLLTAVALALTIPLAPLIFRKDASEVVKSPRLAALAGIICGFGIVSKITFAPLVLMLFLFSGRRARSFFAAGAAISAFVFLLPVITHIPRMATWFISLATHTERYGGGEFGWPTTAALAANISTLYSLEPGFFWFIAYYLGLAVLFLPGRLVERRVTPIIIRLLVVGSASIGLITAMIIKQGPAAHYLVPALAVIPFLNAALFWHLLSSSLSRKMKSSLLGIGLLPVVISGANSIYEVDVWINRAIAYRGNIRKLETALAQQSECVVLPHYRSSLVTFALAFGNDFSSGVHAQTLARLFPNFVYFNVFTDEFRNFAGPVSASAIRGMIEQGRCVLSVGSPLQPGSQPMRNGLALLPLIDAGDEAIYRLGLGSSSSAHADSSASGVIVVEAESYSAGTVVVDKAVFGLGIGVLTSPVYPAQAEYKIRLHAAGPYEVHVRYASAESRPVRLSANGILLSATMCAEPTGGFHGDSQVWHKVGVFDLVQGINTIVVAGDQPFPHIDKFSFAPAKP